MENNIKFKHVLYLAITIGAFLGGCSLIKLAKDTFNETYEKKDLGYKIHCREQYDKYILVRVECKYPDKVRKYYKFDFTTEWKGDPKGITYLELTFASSTNK